MEEKQCCGNCKHFFKESSQYDYKTQSVATLYICKIQVITPWNGEPFQFVPVKLNRWCDLWEPKNGQEMLSLSERLFNLG